MIDDIDTDGILPEAEQPEKRKRGRPKGSVSKPKLDTCKEEAATLVGLYKGFIDRRFPDSPLEGSEFNAHVQVTAEMLRKYGGNVPIEIQFAMVVGAGYFARAGIPDFVKNFGKPNDDSKDISN